MTWRLLHSKLYVDMAVHTTDTAPALKGYIILPAIKEKQHS